MQVVSIIMLSFAFLGALDRIFGNKFGIGKEFEKGFLLLGQLVLSMMGMIVIAPVIADLLAPVFNFVYDVFHIEPSIIPASLFTLPPFSSKSNSIVCKAICITYSSPLEK